jgi:hypothetical protein
MSMSGVIDAQLVAWGSRLFAQGPSPKVKAQPKGLRVVLGGKVAPKGGVRLAPSAKAVRAKLWAMVRHRPEAMVKITGAGKGARPIKACFSYISRGGEIPLENEEGDIIEGKDAITDLMTEWRYGDLNALPPQACAVKRLT